MALYTLEGLSLVLGGSEVLAVPWLTISQGDRLAFLGPNGSGKTSLLKILAALVAPTSGTLRFDGSPVSSVGALKGRAVYLHQTPYLFAGTVSYNVEFGARARRVSSRDAVERAEAAMSLVGLDGFGSKGHRALSGGEAQRVALARAFCSGAQVLLLDEPTASADTASRETIARAIARKAAEGLTIVLATHDVDLARAIGASTLDLERGKIRKAATQ